MKDALDWKPALREAIDEGPRGLVTLTPAAQRAQPVPENDTTKLAHCSAVGRHGVIGEVATHDLPEPEALLAQWCVPMLPERISDLSQFGPHAVASRASAQLEASCPGARADMREAQEVERLRFAKATPCAVGRREAAELDQARLVRVQRQRERRQPLCQ